MSASAFDIAAGGMAIHRAEMDAIAANIASVGAARAAGVAHRPPAAFAAAEAKPTYAFADFLDGAMGEMPGGAIDDWNIAPPLDSADVAALGAIDDNPIEQMVSLVAAGRAYDADVAALQAAKQMNVEAIDVDRL